MGIENATYIKDLIPTWPEGTDPKSQGDDHLRLLKAVLQDQFPGFTTDVAVTVTADHLNDSYTETEATAALALKAPLADPALTGIPTAPTAAPGTDTTQLATTAFAKAQSDSGAIGVGQTRQAVTRISGTTYTNSTGKAIQWNFTQLSGVTCTTTIGGVVVAFVNTPSGGAFAHSFIIPNGSEYGYVCTLTSDQTELR